MQRYRPEPAKNPFDVAKINSLAHPQKVQNISITASEIETLFEYYLSGHCYAQLLKTASSKRHIQFGHNEPDGRRGLARENAEFFRTPRLGTAQLYFTYLKNPL